MAGILGQQAPPPASILGQQWWPQQSILGGAQSAPPQGSLWDGLMSMFRRRGEQLAAHPTPAFDAMVNAPVGRIGQLDAALWGREGMTQDDMVGFGADMGGLATTGSLMAPAVRGGVGMGIKAYHGSPHDFDRFSMDKIGTGEGAQAYGHGLYFAESKGVAKSYRDNLSYGTPVKNIADDDVRKFVGDLEESYGPTGYGEYEYTEGAKNLYQDNPELADKLLANMPQFVKNPGRTYEVSIDASPDEFLDWDKPLSEQPGALKRLGLEKDDTLADGTGQNFYETMNRSFAKSSDPRWPKTVSPDDTAAWLREKGIKGIRYKDAGSRDPQKMKELADDLAQYREAAKHWAETGNEEKLKIANKQIEVLEQRVAQTHNYVVFDEKTIAILKKYGLAGLTGGGAATGFATYNGDDGG